MEHERRNLMSMQKGILMIKKSLWKSLMFIWTLVLLLSIVAPAMAQQNRITLVSHASTFPTQPQGPTDTAEMQTFMDGLLKKEMEENHIVGAAVSVVKDGKLFFAKGYGYADVEKGIPVDADRTLFGIGSVGKLFTWTAVMQLVEEGKLDLDADINTYLDFLIPDTYPQPITLKHLMTHTSGFENRLLDSVVYDPNDLVSARDWLVTHMHARVRPPGEAAGYSNFNAMLAGYIVARVSGQRYEQYIQEHIFNPLGMRHSTAQSPMPPDLRAYASVGYTYANGAFHAFPPYTAQPAALPSGMHHATVTDMARFMIAHLQNGRYSDADISDARILRNTTALQMHSTLYTPDPNLLGTKYGFFDFSDNGQRTLGHSGELPPTMQSLLLILPDQNLGVFVVYNSTGGTDLTPQHLGFQRAFFDHYYPAPAVTPVRPPTNITESTSRFLGSYRWTMGSRTTIMKIIGLFGAVEVKDSGDGTLLLATPFRDWRFVQVEPLYFRQVDGTSGLAFHEDEQGNITYMFTDLMPQFAYEKLDWYEAPGFQMPLVLVCLLAFLSMITTAAIRFIQNRRTKGNQSPTTLGERVAYPFIVGISLLNLLFVLGFALWGEPPAMLLSLTLVAKIVLGLGVLSALLTAGALVYCVLAWKDGYWGIAFRVYYTLLTMAAVAFVWFMNYWNMLGWQY
jgi:CubicO group peptidase (beta-lactamase class C family)